MNRKLLLIANLYLTGMLCNACNEGVSSVRQKQDKPNIVILFCDDLGYGDLTSFGHPTIKTPNLDQMVSDGMKFTNFYSGSPACTASRYSLLTGRYPKRSGFSWVLSPTSPRGIHPKEITMAEALKGVGYATGMFGKWHLGSTKPEYLPLQNGFDEYVGLPYSNDMRPPKWPSIPLLQGNDTLELDPDQSKLTALYTERAIDFIRRNKEQPFFVYLPYAMPHVPLYPGQDFSGASRRGLYGDVVEEIDWSVGKIREILKEEGLEQQTLIIFASDNGPWIIKNQKGGSSGLLRDGKGSTWEGGMHVPGIACWPGKITAGSLCMNPASTLDMYATILTIAGAEVPTDRAVDGRDIKGWLFESDHQPAVHPYYYYGPRELHALRKGPWKLHVKTSSQTGKDYFEGKLPLLFNLDIDPSEQYDVSDENPDIVQDLLAEIKQHKKEVAEASNFFDREETHTD